MKDRFDWLISEPQSVNYLRETISILSGKYKRFTFYHLVFPKLLNLSWTLKMKDYLKSVSKVLSPGL